MHEFEKKQGTCSLKEKGTKRKKSWAARLPSSRIEANL
jgi:hypothetical protein